MLIPVLRAEAHAAHRDSSTFAKNLVTECRQYIAKILPFTANELEFLDYILTKGTIQPELITSDEALKAKILAYPMLLWKIQNVRQHHGIK